MFTEKDKKLANKIIGGTMNYPKIQQSWQNKESNITIRAESEEEFPELKKEMKEDIFKVMGWEVE